MSHHAHRSHPRDKLLRLLNVSRHDLETLTGSIANWVGRGGQHVRRSVTRLLHGTGDLNAQIDSLIDMICQQRNGVPFAAIGGFLGSIPGRLGSLAKSVLIDPNAWTAERLRRNPYLTPGELTTEAAIISAVLVPIGVVALLIAVLIVIGHASVHLINALGGRIALLLAQMG